MAAPISESGTQNCLELRITGLNVPSFKNTKMIMTPKRKRNPDPLNPPRPLLITDPKKQAIMDRITDDFVSQLRSWCQTKGIATETESFRRFLTAGSLPLDDCLAWIGQISVSWRRVWSGHEGVIVRIEKL
jgi:hypothetical protein